MEDIKELIFKLLKTVDPNNIFENCFKYDFGKDCTFSLSWYYDSTCNSVEIFFCGSGLSAARSITLNGEDALLFNLLTTKVSNRAALLDEKAIKRNLEILLDAVPKTFDSEAEKVLNE